MARAAVDCWERHAAHDRAALADAAQRYGVRLDDLERFAASLDEFVSNYEPVVAP